MRNNIKEYTVQIRGITPLLMNSDRICNPLLPLTKKLKEITGIRKKTDDHYHALSKLEFEAHMYYHDDIGIYMPSKCLQGCIKAAAKKSRKGKDTKAIVMKELIGYPLIPYAGKTIEGLYAEKNTKGYNQYVHLDIVVVNKARILRTRPIFHKWEVEFSFYLDTEIFEENVLKKTLEIAGYEFGLCDLRPGLATGPYGKFEVINFTKS